jgi:hypothetical protein
MITLECNYSKKIGLPGFSSHQFSITLKTEISDLSVAQAESARLYKLLQSGVDHSLQEIGFLPGLNGNGNGHSPAHTNGNGNGNGNGNSHVHGKTDSHAVAQPPPESWKCSQKQKELILRIAQENHLEMKQVEELATGRFGKSVQALNKLETSGLIDELLEQYGDSSRSPSHSHSKAQSHSNGHSRSAKAGGL